MKDNADPQPKLIGEDKEQIFLLTGATDLEPLMKRIGVAQFVLLGEASHGTHEYYTWRTAITKRLIEEKGFNIIAVEGDWPDCYKLNRFIKGFDNTDKNASDIVKFFNRWPTWMWANWEIVALIEWLRQRNSNLYQNEKTGFYGLDVYSLWESLATMLSYLEKTDTHAAQVAKKAILCFEFAGEDGQAYAREWQSLPESCREPVIQLLREIRKKAPIYDHDPEAALNMEQNAHVAVNAEVYYRNMIGFRNDTWNLRDTHMVETLNRLINFHGKNARVVVWEHNTHIGDARFTDMKKAGMINVGQLVREQQGNDNTVLVGFGSYEGTVIAGQAWGAPMQEMEVPPAKKGSVERLLHDESAKNKLLVFDQYNKKERFGKVMPHRAIGVVYDPDHEKYGNYVPTILNARYDAFIYLDQTKALHPLHLHPDPEKTPDTYPFEY
jgi:erythromycin esterase-like protein